MNLKIAVVSNTVFFNDYKNALVREIKNKGFEAVALTAIDYDHKPDAFIIIGMHRYKKLIRHNEFIYCGIQTEQLPSRWTGGRSFGANRLRHFRKYYKQYDIIYEWSKELYDEMHTKFKNITYFPHSTYDEIVYPITNSAQPRKQYDLIFIGDPHGIDNRREHLLSKLKNKFNVFPQSNQLWGKNKAEAIQNSKICLNIHFDNASYCEYPRLFEYLSNRKFVLSEKMKNPYPFTDGIDYASFYPNEIENIIEYYLGNGELMSSIANNGYETSKKFELSSTIDKLIMPILIEKSFRKKIDYRILNNLFHISGIDSLKDITNNIYMLKEALIKS